MAGPLRITSATSCYPVLRRASLSCWDGGGGSCLLCPCPLLSTTFRKESLVGSAAPACFFLGMLFLSSSDSQAGRGQKPERSKESCVETKLLPSAPASPREHMTTAGKGLHLFPGFPRNRLRLLSCSGLTPVVGNTALAPQHGHSYQGRTKTSWQLSSRTHLLHRRIFFKLDPNDTPVAI